MGKPDAARDFALKYAEHMQTYIPPCPWNPFPVNSPWGREIERRYRQNELDRRSPNKADMT